MFAVAVTERREAAVSVSVPRTRATAARTGTLCKSWASVSMVTPGGGIAVDSGVRYLGTGARARDAVAENVTGWVVDRA